MAIDTTQGNGKLPAARTGALSIRTLRRQNSGTAYTHRLYGLRKTVTAGLG